jgi:lipopolysaccharide export system protein LptC
MPSKRRNRLLILLFIIVFAVTFALEAREANAPSTSTTIGLRLGSPLR